MTSQADLPDERPGALLNKMLAGHRTFLENVYSLMRFLEAQVGQAGWTLVKPGGFYAATRSGVGSGLASFAKADWVATYAGIAFVRAGATEIGGTITRIPRAGLDVLVFQVRWLDKAPQEPVVWHAKLQVERNRPEADEAWSTKKWEDFQTEVFRKLEREGPPDGAPSGTVKPGTVVRTGTEILFAGQFTEVPVSSLLSQEDAMALLVEPALENSRKQS
jgi:hypothetical protein